MRGYLTQEITISNELKNVFSAGEHGSTFGGNPLACATGKAVLSELLEHGLLNKVPDTGAYFMHCLNALKNDFPMIKAFDVYSAILSIIIIESYKKGHGTKYYF